MNKKNIINLLLLLSGAMSIPAHAIQFTFKGGASNTIDVVLFKNRKNFETFIEHVGGSAESAKAVEDFTKANAALIASTGAAIITLGALAASQGTLSPAASAINALAGAGLTGATLLSGKLAHVGAGVIKSFAKDYASHYFENINLHPNNTVCRGAVGDKLVRRRDFPSGKPNYMNFAEPQPMYLVIFNKENVPDPYNPKIIISKPYTIIFAGEIKAEHLSSIFDIRTEVVTYYDTDKYGKQKLDERGYPIVIERVVGVRLDITDKDGSLVCPNATVPLILKVTTHIKWVAGLNHILKNNIANSIGTIDNNKQLATRIVDQITQVMSILPESEGNYRLDDNKNISVKTVQDAVANINTLITQASSNNQLNDVVIAVNNLLKSFEYYVNIKL